MSKIPRSERILNWAIVIWIIWGVIVTLFFGWHDAGKMITSPLIHIP